MDRKPLNDEERQEFNHLREEIIALKKENEGLRALLASNQPTEPKQKQNSILKSRIFLDKNQGFHLINDISDFFFSLLFIISSKKRKSL